MYMYLTSLGAAPSRSRPAARPQVRDKRQPLKGCRAGTPSAVKMADDRANAPPTLPRIEAWGAAPDLEGNNTPDAADADRPDAKARSASNETPPSEGVAAHMRLKSKQSSAFETSEAIMSDPASVVDHEARHTRWAELFNEALMSYRDVSVAAVVVSWVLLCMWVLFGWAL